MAEKVFVRRELLHLCELGGREDHVVVFLEVQPGKDTSLLAIGQAPDPLRLLECILCQHMDVALVHVDRETRDGMPRRHRD